MIWDNIKDNRLRQRMGEHIHKLSGAWAFGGYPLASALRSQAAEAFYEKHPYGDYLDSKVDPETALDRCCLPTDIDLAFLSNSDTSKFCKRLIKDGFKVTDMIIDDTRSYTINVSENVVHRKIAVKVAAPAWMRHEDFYYEKKVIYVDILYPTNPVKDINEVLKVINLDFECNGLIITPSGDFGLHPLSFYYHEWFRASPWKRAKMIMDITKGLMSKKTDLSVHYKKSPIRALKMAHKGWRLMGDYCEMVQNPPVKEECVICMKSMKNRIAIKGTCCEGWIHHSCCIEFVKTRQNKNCLFCGMVNPYDENLLGSAR